MISSYSGKLGNCIDVVKAGDKIIVTETDYPHLPMMTTKENFSAFIKGVKDGEFDHLIKE